METIRLFDTAQQAREYRHEHGTGGWIFEPIDVNEPQYQWHQAVLFPPHMTPSQIFNHPISKGRTGKLISN
jgi:hypothetical protein